MSRRIVTDEDMEKALCWLRDSAIDIGNARERLIQAEYRVKHIEALLLRESTEKTVDAKKAEAKCDQRWIDATNEEAEAAGEFEKMKALREAASAKIGAWQTESANYRGMRV